MTTSDHIVADAARTGIAARRAKGRAGKRPRLLVIGPLPPPFIGPAVATRRLLDSAVLARYFDIDHVNTGDPEGFDDIGRFGWHNVKMALKHGAECLGILIRRRPDAIYVPIARGLWGFVRDLLFIVPARVLGTRVIVHLRAGRFDLIHDNGPLGRAIARIGFSLVDRALVLGTTVRDVFGSAIDARHVGIVPNGMLLDGWDSDDWIEQRRREHSQASGSEPASMPAPGAAVRPIRIAYIANLYHDKGIHVMLEAMTLLERAEPPITVTFAGDWGNEQYRVDCLATVHEKDLGERVAFIGRVDEDGKRALLAASDIAVFVPVKPEGLPWVVLEAMAAALPVIGTPQGTIPELILDGTSGYLVAVDDARELAGRVAELAADDDRRVAMGREGRARVEEIYTEEKTHERLAQEVLACIDRKAGRQARGSA